MKIPPYWLRHHCAKNKISEYEYHWERTLAGLFGIGQIGLSITGLVSIVPALRSREEVYYWLDVVIMCNL
jgi:hypothetical protein